MAASDQIAVSVGESAAKIQLESLENHTEKCGFFDISYLFNNKSIQLCLQNRRNSKNKFFAVSKRVCFGYIPHLAAIDALSGHISYCLFRLRMIK